MGDAEIVVDGANDHLELGGHERLTKVVKSLENVLARGHGTIPIPHNDVRLLVDAAWIVLDEKKD